MRAGVWADGWVSGIVCVIKKMCMSGQGGRASEKANDRAGGREGEQVSE